MGEIRSHRDLIAWQKAMDLVVLVYRLSKAFPDAERFGLTSQLRRAAVSVPSKIAEGYGRGPTGDYLRFLRAARGSLFEVDTQTMLAARLEFVPDDAFAAIQDRIQECGRILAALIRSLEDKDTSVGRTGSGPNARCPMPNA